MRKQEQIEEMAKLMCIDTSNRGECEKCSFKPHKVFEFIHQCSKYDNAETLYNVGYRKADEVRKETAEKFAEKLKEKIDNQQYILLPTATVKYMTDEIAKEIISEYGVRDEE